MPRPTQSTLRRAAWEVAELADEDRAWMVEQLSADERRQLTAVLNDGELLTDANDSVHGGLHITGLPRWLTARAMLALPQAERREEMQKMSLVERLKLVPAIRAAERAPLTALAAQTLLACLTARRPEPTQ